MRAAGFSLLELVIGLVIAAILAALAIPYFSDAEAKAAWFHEQVKAALRYAQRQAVASRRPVYVFLAPGEIKLCYNDPCTTSSDELPGYRFGAPSGVAISTPTPSFSFNGLGQPSIASTLVFTVAGKPVTVWAETGYVP